MSPLFIAAAIELGAMWLVWFYPFLRKRFSGPPRQSNVMAHSGDLGLALQTAGMLLAFVRWPFRPEAWWPRMILSMLVAPAGAIFGWMAARHLGKQLRILAGLYPDHELIRTGPYGIVRHPIYLSMFLMMLATGLLLARWPVLLTAIVLYVAGTEIRIDAEEGLLGSRFGAAFDEYRRTVPAYLPFVR